MKHRHALILVSALATLLSFGCPNPNTSDSDEDDPELARGVFFPTNVGAEWVYGKTTTNSITSETVPGEKIEYLYLALRNYDGENGTYEFSVTQYVKRIKYYGAPDGMSDLITYENIEYPVYLRNGHGILEFRMAPGEKWRTLMSIDDSADFPFSSFLIKAHDMQVRSSEYSDFIDSLPMNELGRFSGVRTHGYQRSHDGNSQKTNWEFYTESVGIIESYYQDYRFDPGFPPYIGSSIDNEVEHVRLLGYDLGNGKVGKDVDGIEYSVVYEY